jgi:anaerobic selenocysteine-containing dehydrogenase
MEIHTETAEKLGISEGDMVQVETPRGGGRIAQKARLTPTLHPRVVHYEAHWWFPELLAAEPSLYGMWDVNVNVVVPNDPPYEDICGTPPLRAILCKIFKVKEN